MDTKMFRKVVGPAAQEVSKKQVEVACKGVRSLATLLLEWYERNLAEEEAEQRDKSN